jgi:hypothetical protein
MKFPLGLAGLQDDIFVQSQGVFQWVVLVIPRIIIIQNRGESTRKIRADLKKIPKDLHQLYETVLDDLKRKNPSQSLKLFQWIYFALRPFTRAELCSAINIDANIHLRSFSDCEETLGFIEDNEQMEKQLCFLSRGLAEWKHHEETGRIIMQPVHQSVKDYLVGQGFRRFDNSLDSPGRTLSSAHARLCRSCIVYFDIKEICASFYQLGPLYQARSYNKKKRLRLARRKALTKIHPLLFYALDSWIHHE